GSSWNVCHEEPVGHPLLEGLEDTSFYCVVCPGDVASPACEAKDAALTFHEPVAPHHARSGAASTRRGTHHAIGTARRCRPNPHACLRLITSAQLCSPRGLKIILRRQLLANAAIARCA